MSVAEILAHAVGIGQINERARLIHGDCLDPVTGLASLPDQSVDHVICDPPYEVEAHTKQRRTLNNGYSPSAHVVARPLEFGAITEQQRDQVAIEVARVCSGWSLMFCQIEAVERWRAAFDRAGAKWRRGGVWLKGGMPQLTGDRPAQGCECIAIVWCGGGRSTWNGGGRSGVWIHRHQEAGIDREHPTQKPLALMRALVEDFTDPGDLILDPFAGSGTTGVAALTLGRRFIGWEMDAKHHATAARRIGETREQPSLLGPRGPKAKQQGFGL